MPAKKNIAARMMPFSNKNGGENEDGNDDDNDEEEDENNDDNIGADEEDCQVTLENEVTPVVHLKRHRDGSENTEPPKKVIKSSAGLFRAPERDELHKLQNLSLLKLQIDELLKEVTLKTSAKRAIDSYIEKLKDFLLNLKRRKEDMMAEAMQVIGKNVSVPFLFGSQKIKGSFQFIPPKTVTVVGSYALGTVVKPKVDIDLLLEIPAEWFSAKDYLDQRYLRKRALYLTALAARLKKSNLIRELRFSYHHGNHAKPILLVYPADDVKRLTVRIHTGIEEGVFKLNKFDIRKNNVRHQWYNGHSKGAGDVDDAAGFLSMPTPHYNSAILEDMLHSTVHKFLQETLRDASGMRDSVVLLKVWLRQRKLDEGLGSFTGFIMTAFVAYLLINKRLNHNMTAYQIFCSTLVHLSTATWDSSGINLMPADRQFDRHLPLIEDFHDAFDVVFVDLTGYLNLCADLYKGVFEWVKHEAKLSVGHFESLGLETFEVLFMTSVSFVRKFDQLIHIEKLEILEKVVAKKDLKAKVIDLYGNYIVACMPWLQKLLKRALASRVHLLVPRLSPVAEWSVDQAPPTHFGLIDKLTFGLVLNLESSNNIVDKGPSVGTDEAAEWREFWGDVCEMRRFVDSSILEAVVWPGQTIAGRRSIVGKIAKHILNRHADIPRNSILVVGGQLDQLLKPAKRTLSKKEAPNYGTGEEQCLSVGASYDELCKLIRSLPDTPLHIHTIQGVSPVLCYAEVFPVVQSSESPSEVKEESGGKNDSRTDLCPPWTPTVKVICLCEGGNKWPDNDEYIPYFKMGIYVKLGQLLEKCPSIIKCSVFPDNILVLKDGYVFQIEIGTLKEISIARTKALPDGGTTKVTTEESVSLEEKLVTLPKLMSFFHGVQQQNSSFSGAVRLAKRWLSSQLLLDDFIREEAIELLVVSLYVKPAPFTSPSSPLVGFLRFLNLLARHDWKMSPLIVNVNDELTRDDCTAFNQRFIKERSTLPAMCLATPAENLASAVTEVDAKDLADTGEVKDVARSKFNLCWSKRKPSVLILERMVQLARESLRILEDLLMQTSVDVDFKQIFRPPLDTYDVIIHLRHNQLARRHEAVDVAKQVVMPKFISHDKQIQDQPMPMVNYDPVHEYLNELRDSFEEFALFFYDVYGGDVIAVLWKPAVFNAMPFSVGHVNCRMVDAHGNLMVNVEAILEEFKILAEGLVKAIETRTERWKI